MNVEAATSGGNWLTRNRFVGFVLQVASDSLRSSLLTGGIVTLMSTFGAWQYLVDSMQAMDMRIAATVERPAAEMQRVISVTIDDTAYQKFFEGQSPLRQDRVAELFRAVAEGAPNAKRIVVDLDLQPRVRDAASRALEDVLRADPQRWVLASIAGDTAEDSAARDVWRSSLCEAGVSFASPMVPTHFGFARAADQYKDAFADVAWAGRTGATRCVSPTQPLQLASSPVSPHGLGNGLVLPFSGDLAMLRMGLQAIDPQWIVLGGAWGKDDRFQTPFGDRFGMQVHTAGLDGRVHHLRHAPRLMELVCAWVFVTALRLALEALDIRLRRWSTPPVPDMAGHHFFLERVRPLILIVTICALLLLLIWILGMVYGYTGTWIPSSTVATVTLATVLFDWSWAERGIRRSRTGREMWHSVFLHPIEVEWTSARNAVTAFFGRGADPAWAGISRPRLAFESLMATASMIAQAGLPLYAIFHPR